MTLDAGASEVLVVNFVINLENDELGGIWLWSDQ